MPSWIKLMLVLIAWVCAVWNWADGWAFWMAIGAALIALGWWMDDCESQMFALTEIASYQTAQEWDAFAGRARTFFHDRPDQRYFADGLPRPSALVALRRDDGDLVVFRVCEHEQIRIFAEPEP